MVQLGELCASFPRQYLQSFYFRLLGGALLDPETNVRLHVLRAVHHALLGDNFELVRSFVNEYRRRLVDIALGDVEMSVRVAAFALLERANAHEMLDAAECSTLAVHVFDVEPRIRVAAAAFLATLVEADSNVDSQVRRLVSLLVQYSSQLDTLDEDIPEDVFDAEDEPLMSANLGRIGIALEALWEATPTLRVWAPYFDVLLDDSGGALTSAEEAVAVEAAVATVRLVRNYEAEQDEVSPLEACSTALIDLFPRLLSRFATDAPRISDLLIIPQYMDLEIFAATRNVAAFDALWDSVCAHFSRHVEPTLLRNAAESLKMLAAAHVSLGTGPAKLRALVDSVLNALLESLSGRSLDTAVFTEDDVHNVRANILRLYALANAVDIGMLDDPSSISRDAPWASLVALARRGRLGQEREVQAVRVALKTLSLAVMWQVREVNADVVDWLVTHRDELFGVLYEYIGSDDDSVSISLRNTASLLTTTLHALFFSVGIEREDDEEGTPQHAERTRLQLQFPGNTQQQCAAMLQYNLRMAAEHVASIGAPEAPARARKTRRDAGLVPLSVLMLYRRVNTFAAPTVEAIQVGAMDVKHAPVLLGLYAYFDNAYNSLCHDLVNVLRDDALHLHHAWIICVTILESLKSVRMD